MAIVVDANRSGQSKTSGTSLSAASLSGTGLAVDDLIIAAIAHDDAAGTYSITNDSGATITWTEHSLSPTTNAGNVGLHYWVGVVTAVSGALVVTFNHPTLTARACNIIQVSGAATSAYEGSSSEATGSSGTPSSGNITSLTGSLLVGIVGIEGPAGDTFNGDAGSSYVASGSNGTSGGGDASNIKLATETRLGIATTLDHSPTITSRDWAHALIEIKVAGGGSLVIPNHASMHYQRRR